MSHATKKGSNTPLSLLKSMSNPTMSAQQIEPRMKLSNVIFFLSMIT
ncbi:hypothetical protein M083_4671 [Bacteroides fragilis str. 3986 T(B)9]|uniref:Uncharacterized protein n=1 Tax=Bacteroides fragilis str. 1007-1-F \|nr:hypothetical protein M101_0551 [Bacteroides fragilis str. 1007-1-F \